MNTKKILSGIFVAAAMLLSANQAKAQVPYLTLNNGVQRPQFGLGTYGIPNNDIAKDAVSFAASNGYRQQV